MIGRRVSQRGLVLVATLVMIVLLAAIVVEFFYNSRIELHLARNMSQGIQALEIADGGLTLALQALSQEAWEDQNQDMAGRLSGQIPVAIGSGTCRIRLTQESGKLNVNRLVDEAGNLNRVQINRCLQMIDLYNQAARKASADPVSYGVVAAIIDWIDADDKITVLSWVEGANKGAESQTYLDQDPACQCKNGPVEVLSELLYVRGVTPELLFGLVDTQTGERVPGLQTGLSTHGGETININYTSSWVLQSLVSDVSERLAEQIIRHRPYQRLQDLQAVPGMSESVYQKLSHCVDTSSEVPYFYIQSQARVGDIRRDVYLLVKSEGRTIVPVMRWE